MENSKIKREIVAMVMKSPHYFTIPLSRRLQFIKFFSQESVFHLISRHQEKTEFLGGDVQKISPRKYLRQSNPFLHKTQRKFVINARPH